jgi:hypothetical protein
VEAVGDQSGGAFHLGRKVRGQGTEYGDGARSAVEPGHDSIRETVHVPPGEGEPVVDAPQTREKGGGLVALLVPAGRQGGATR